MRYCTTKFIRYSPILQSLTDGCMNTGLCTCMHVCMNICMYVNTLYVCKYACRHTCMYMCAYVRMCEYTTEFLCIGRPIRHFILFAKYF